MDKTRLMIEILGRLRRERNGAAADSMRICGRACGLNYGVSLPTLRVIAQDAGKDHEFAKFLYLQDVRELRLAALTIADPSQIFGDETDFWAAGIVNSEIAEEAAMKLLNHVPDFGRLFFGWISCGDRFLQYAALMSAARRSDWDMAWIEAAASVVRNNPDDMLLAAGCVAALTALACDADTRPTVERAVASLPSSPAADLVRYELAWRND